MPRVILLVLGAMVVVLLVMAMLPVENQLLGLTYVDDGFYYLGYARNVALGNGPTFDGVVTTNGVQPLWAGLLAATAALFRDPTALMHAGLVLSIALLVVSVLAMHDALGQLFPRDLRTLVTLLYIAFIAAPPVTLTGMEIPINLAMCAITLAAVLRVRTLDARSVLGAGALMGLTVLARVDNLVLIPAYLAILLWRGGALFAWRRMMAAALWFALPVVVIFGVYVALNRAQFGTLMPVSGEIKSTYATFRAEPFGGRLSPGYLALTTERSVENYLTIINNYFTMLFVSFSPVTLIVRYVMVAGLLGLLALVFVKRRRLRVPRVVATRPGLFVVAVVALTVYWHSWLLYWQLGQWYAGVTNWYFVPEYTFITLAIGFVLRFCTQMLLAGGRFYRLASAAVIVVLAVSVGVLFYHVQNPAGVSPLLDHYRATVWANGTIPPDEVVGSWNSGVVGYFLDAPVINLDGLMNNAEMLAIVKGEADMGDYFRRYDIRWIMEYTAADWTPGSEATFRGVPMAWLEQVYSAPFGNYGYIDDMYHVFRVTPS